MTTQVVATQKNGNQFFERSPDDTTFSIFEWIRGRHGSISQTLPNDDRALILTAGVCKQWQTDSNLREEREGATTRLRQRAHLFNLHREFRLVTQYPRPLIQIFQNHHHMPFSQLPVLEGRNFTLLSPEDLPHPVMQVRNPNGHSAIAIRMQTTQGNRNAVLICFHYPLIGQLGGMVREGRRVRMLAGVSDMLRGILTHQHPFFRIS